MSYGIAVNNAQGDILFDSRRQMDSYVVASYANGFGVVGSFNDLLFIKGDVSVKDKLVVVSRTFNSNGTISKVFETFDPSTNTLAPVSLDYLHLMPSAMIGPDTNDNFGFQVRNPDGTIQFDSRSIKSDAHYEIVDVHRRHELWGNGLGSPLTSDSSQYVEVGRTTSATVLIGAVVNSIKFTGSQGNIPVYYAYSNTSGFSFLQNQTAMFVAELDV